MFITTKPLKILIIRSLLLSKFPFSVTLDMAKLKKVGVINFFKAFVIIVEWLARDENVQVNGVCVFNDLTNMPMSIHTSIMGTENGRKHLDFFDVSFWLCKLVVFFVKRFIVLFQ